MMINPTAEQSVAISSVGNTLVSAAAGSGKTAVLVERVIRLLTDKETPVSADKLLVVTFTNAAAAEMRSRIEKSLDDYCREHSDDPHLTLQRHRLRAAKICTIDSFCIELVRENFEHLDIAPDFKIGEKAALFAINEKVVSDIIEEYLKADDRDFSNLLDLIGTEKDEQNMKDFLLSIYNSAQHLSFPEECYDSLAEFYNNGNFKDDSPWADYAFSVAEAILDRLTVSLQNARNALMISEDSYLKYSSAFTIAIEVLNSLKALAIDKKWDSFYSALHSLSLPKLPPKAAKVTEDEDVEWAKSFYREIPKRLTTLKNLFYADREYIDLQFKKLYPSVLLLSNILKELGNRIFSEYKKANIFDFHNIEHLALSLLCERVEGGVKAKDNIEDFSSQYDVVMVDEYQDVNELQDTLFELLSKNGKNLFVVGDIKQSIYGFRGSDIRHFNAKRHNSIPYREHNNELQKRVVLSRNFRTKPQVCEFINYVFGLIMTDKTGVINYDDQEMLFPAAEYPKTNAAAVEISLIETEDSGYSTFEAETLQIIQYIKEVMNSGEVIRESKESLRRARYSDFAVLLRNVSTNGAAMAQMLKNAGIPVSISNDEFTENKEIKLFLRLLAVIDNPASDVDLLCVLLSPIFGWTADEMANIRATDRYQPLYVSVMTAADGGNEKAQEFIKWLEKMRLISVTLPIDRFLRFLMEETGYLDMITVLEDGGFKRANLLLLCDYAKKFVSEGITDVGAFARKMRSSAPSLFKGAGLHTENSVRIMSIHKSKGLQFPVCIVAGLASAFSTKHKKQRNLFTTDFGIGFKYFDEELKAQQTTPSFEAISTRISRMMPEEELRLFYVALTRTQDRLHLVMAHKNIDGFIESVYRELLCSDFDIDRNLLCETTSFAQWLIMALLLHPQGAALLMPGRVIPTVKTDTDFFLRRVSAAEISVDDSAALESEGKVNEEVVLAAKENFEYKYLFEDILGIEAKTSVSKLANSAEAAKYAFENKPAFMSPQGITATGRGTAVHKCMQFLDFDKTDDLEAELDRLYEWQYITEEEREAVDVKAIEGFVSSSLFERIRSAETVKREMRFLTEVEASKLEPSLDPEIYNEKVIIQGAVDLCFVEDDGVFILDFKTDRVDSPERLIEAYSEQLEIYSMACEKIFGKRVKEKIIYSFSLNKAIKL